MYDVLLEKNRQLKIASVAYPIHFDNALYIVIVSILYIELSGHL